MEKVLRLYQIPDVESIITVFGSGDTLPESGFSENDLFINLNTDGLYKAVENQSQQLQWVQIQFDETKYYRDQSEDTPLFFTFSQQYGLNEYDVSFPQNAERAAEITSFTFSSTRMGNAPTISGTLMYRQCLDELWTDRVCVLFNKTFFFIDKIPTSEFLGGAVGRNANVDDRYKHSCELVSERKLLENVYFTNVVDIDQSQEDITRLPMQWLQFSFNGGIDEFIRRLNLSLAYSGLDAQHAGFRVVKDALPTVEEKLITISETTLKSALDLIYETWGIPYWFDGYTIHIGYSNEQQMQQAGITMPTFQYGAVQSLLSLQKSQSNDIVNRITGFGSEENIPTFYPNKNPNAIELMYQRNQTLMVDYAKIVNPYKTVKLEPSESVHQGVPSGSYFKYMPITKTYNYDQFMSVNTHASPKVVDEDGEPSLVLKAIEDYNCQSMYFVQEYGGTPAIIGHSNSHPEYNIICKRIWVWLKEGTLVNLSFKDEMKAVEMFKKGGASQVLFYDTNVPKFFVKAQSYTYTREQYETVIGNNQGFNPNSSANLIDKYFTLRTEGSGVVYVWDDGTETDTYNEEFPIDIQSLPAGTTCLSFTVGLMVRYNDATAPVSYVQTQFKTTTNTVITHEFLSDSDWSLNADGHVAHLWRYGIRLNSGVTPLENDIIYFTREAGALPYFGQLLPYSFRETNDIWLNAKNNEYLKENGTDYYTFENLYKISCAKEHVENFEDIKPTIKGMVNNDTPAKRIDQILDVAFDQDDNNDLMENGTDYQHPYFFVKLAKTSLDDGYSFNLFDCAIEGQTMQINMADGNCGGCTFDVLVKYQSDGMAINPVGVFEEATTINGVTYAAGTPKRNLQTGDVLVTRREDAQQDTSASEVWIALKKDNQTFGHYSNGAEVVYPDKKRGNNFIPHTGDSFTITNICLPYAYIVAAEKRLYHALLDYMEKNNPRTWSFSVKFSSIYYKKHYEFMDRWFYEASRIPFIYNGITRKYYVQSYSYKMGYNSSLPEVTVELNEEVKKRNVYYPVPYNPFGYVQDEYTLNQTKIKKTLSEYIGSIRPSDSEVDNLQVNGDVILKNGVSLNAQIAAINSQIFSNEKIRTKEYAWGEIAKRAEIENMFIDGVFATDYNEYDTTKVRIISGGQGVVGNSCINAVFEDSVSYFSFRQKLAVEELASYTFAFYVKSSNGSSVDVTITQYDGQGNVLDSTVVNAGLGQDWAQKAVFFYTLQDAEYVVAKIANGGEETAVSVYIDGVSLYADNYTAFDQDGNPVINSMLPAKYRMSTADIFNAIDKLDGGGSSDNVFICTLTSNTNPCTMDKTTYEIAQAVADGKEVVCIDPYNNRVYRVVDANNTPNSQIHFGSIYTGSTYNLYSNLGSERWHKFSANLQTKLYDSGESQNIKTINNQTLLGSGNIDTKEIVWCFFTETDSTNHTGTMSMTISEIREAINNRKIICLIRGELFYYLVNKGSGSAQFVCVQNNTVYTISYYSSDNLWHYYSQSLQPVLSSGTNIKTINGNSVLGSGNIIIGVNIFSGSTVPTSVIGSDGDIYIQEVV